MPDKPEMMSVEEFKTLLDLVWTKGEDMSSGPYKVALRAGEELQAAYRIAHEKARLFEALSSFVEKPADETVSIIPSRSFPGEVILTLGKDTGFWTYETLADAARALLQDEEE